MYSRIITCSIDRSRIDEFRTVLNQEFLPRIQRQPGFIENIESLDSGRRVLLHDTLEFEIGR